MAGIIPDATGFDLKPRLTFGKTGNPDPAVLKRIFDKRPHLGALLAEHGSMTLRNLSRANLSHLPSPNPARKQECIGAISRLTASRLGTKTGEALAQQLDRFYGASTSDHHGSLNTGLAASACTMFAAGSDELTHIPVLTCASVSLNNEDEPRGLLFHSHGQRNKDLMKQLLPLIPSRLCKHRSIVYSSEPFTAENIRKAGNMLRTSVENETISREHGALLSEMLHEVLSDPDVMGSGSLCEQFTKINHALWSTLSGGGTSVPGLLYLELEEVVSDLLMTHHCHSQTAIHRLVFDPEMTGVVNDLHSAMVPFVRQGNIATYLFWGIRKATHQRIALKLSEGTLVSEDGTFKLALDRQAIEKALREKFIMPNLLLIFTVLHLYYGFNCLGGFNQMHYLNAMRTAYDRSGIDVLSTTGNSLLYNYGLDLFFLGDERLPAYGLDLYLYGEKDRWRQAMEALDSIRFADAFAANAHIVHDLLYPPSA